MSKSKLGKYSNWGREFLKLILKVNQTVYNQLQFCEMFYGLKNKMQLKKFHPIQLLLLNFVTRSFSTGKITIKVFLKNCVYSRKNIPTKSWKISVRGVYAVEWFASYNNSAVVGNMFFSSELLSCDASTSLNEG